jgi:DNA-binding XRE family transcriptional regulator
MAICRRFHRRLKPWPEASTTSAPSARSPPEARERVDRIKRAMRLEIAPAALRELRGASQTELAEALGTSRPNVGRIEKEVDVRLSTLERYVEALGGKLEIHAVFDDADIKLTA